MQLSFCFHPRKLYHTIISCIIGTVSVINTKHNIQIDCGQIPALCFSIKVQCNEMLMAVKHYRFVFGFVNRYRCPSIFHVIGLTWFRCVSTWTSWLWRSCTKESNTCDTITTSQFLFIWDPLFIRFCTRRRPNDWTNANVLPTGRFVKRHNS